MQKTNMMKINDKEKGQTLESEDLSFYLLPF